MEPGSIDYYLFGTHVVFGHGAAANVDAELAALGLSRPVVLMQARMADSDEYATIRTRLNKLQVLEISDIPQHSSISLIETVIPDVKVFGPDCIVAIGGGSVSDSAKALAMLLAEGGRMRDHATVFVPPITVSVPVRTAGKLPIIAIPTTASGAELTPSFGLRNDAEKILFWNRSVPSTSILIDPVVYATVPLAIMRYTAMNGIAHCLEGMYSKNKSLVSDALAMQAMALFASALNEHVSDEVAQRRDIMLAGHMAGMVLSMARSCLHHAVCHVIGARYDLGHGVINTVMLPHTIRFNESTVQSDLAPVLTLVNRDYDEPFTCVSDWVAHVIRTLGLPGTLTELGVKASEAGIIAAHVMNERGLAFNPRPVSDASDIEALLHQAF